MIQNSRPNRPEGIRRQSGAVLVIAMIMLLVLTLLGVTAMNTTSMQERMAANSQELNRLVGRHAEFRQYRRHRQRHRRDRHK